MAARPCCSSWPSMCFCMVAQVSPASAFQYAIWSALSVSDMTRPLSVRNAPYPRIGLGGTRPADDPCYPVPGKASRGRPLKSSAAASPPSVEGTKAGDWHRYALAAAPASARKPRRHRTREQA